MLKYLTQNLDRADLMLNFMATLPNVDKESGIMELVRTPRGDVAEHYMFRTTFPRSQNPSYLHGTTYHALPGILAEGFKDPWDHELQEFTDAGIYFADALTPEVFYHGVHTRFTSEADPTLESVPFCNIILKAACEGKCIAKRSYGECNQIVFPAASTSVQEIHIYRGWCFYNKGCKYFPFVGAEETAVWASTPPLIVSPPRSALPAPSPSAPMARSSDFLQSEAASSGEPWTVDGSARPTTLQATSRPPPSPPEIRWKEFIYAEESTGRKIPFYFNTTTGAKQWEMPAEPYHPAVPQPRAPDVKPRVTPEAVEATKSIPETTPDEEWAPGKRWSWEVCVRCAKCQVLMNIRDFH